MVRHRELPIAICLSLFLAACGQQADTDRHESLERVEQASSHYREETIPAGTVKRVEIGSGERFGDVLYDITADGAGVAIVPSGSDWTVENIGFKGSWNAESFAIMPAVDEGSTGVIRNIHAESYGSNGGGVWVTKAHAGELIIDQVWLEGFPNNGVYASSAGKHRNGQMGRVVIRNAYAINNNPANLRTGSPDALLENCVMFYDKRPEDYPLNNSGGVSVRGFWNRGFDATIKDSDIDIPPEKDGSGMAVLSVHAPTHPRADDATTYLENTRINGGMKGNVQGTSAGDPRHRIPAGVPRSPEEAAAGEGAPGDDESDLPHKLVIEGTGEETTTTYAFEVYGELERSAVLGSLDDADSVEGNRAEGEVWGDGTDGFRYSGDIVGCEFDGVAEVRRDENVLDFESFCANLDDDSTDTGVGGDAGDAGTGSPDTRHGGGTGATADTHRHHDTYAPDTGTAASSNTGTDDGRLEDGCSTTGEDAPAAPAAWMMLLVALVADRLLRRRKQS